MSASKVLQAYRDIDWKITTAESCTGGLVCAALTAIPGSSDVVDRGFVTYSNEAKIQMLGVSPETLEKHGAVSEATAGEMAVGALKNSDAQVAISVTGIAGPGGSDFKPEGMVCFGLAQVGTPVITLKQHYGAIGRDAVRASAVDTAIEQLLVIISKKMKL